MHIQEIKQLIKLVEKSNIGELELEEEGRKIRITKISNLLSSSAAGNGIPNSVIVQPSAPVISPPTPQPSTPAPAAPEPADSDKYYEVRSPMVGTFYRSPSLDAASYVEVGDQVSVGSKLCIIVHNWKAFLRLGFPRQHTVPLICRCFHRVLCHDVLWFRRDVEPSNGRPCKPCGSPSR